MRNNICQLNAAMHSRVLFKVKITTREGSILASQIGRSLRRLEQSLIEEYFM